MTSSNRPFPLSLLRMSLISQIVIGLVCGIVRLDQGSVKVAGLDIGTLNQTVQTMVGLGAVVRARKDVDVFALSRKDVQTYAVSVGGGFVGVAAAVTVWSIGTQSTTTYEDDGGGSTDKGDWISGTLYGKGDIVHDGGQKYYAKKTFVTGSPTSEQSTNAAATPASNTADWAQVETKQALSSTGSDSRSGADDAAKGDGGYKDAVNGASTRDAGPWSGAVAYKQGDVVTYSGQKYVARGAIEATPSMHSIA